MRVNLCIVTFVNSTCVNLVEPTRLISLNLKHFFIVLTTCIGMVLTGCGGSKNLSQVKSVGKKQVSKSEFDQETSMRLRSLFIDAQAQKNIGNLNEAMELLNQVLSIDPNNDAALYDQALILDSQKEYGTAINKVNQARAIDESNKWYKVLAADLYAYTNQLEEAEKIYAELAGMGRDFYEFNYDLASLRMKKGDFNGAIKALDEVEKEIGLNEELVLQKHALYLETRQPQKSRDELQKLIDNNPNQPDYHMLVARTYEIEGNQEKVLETYAKVQELDPDNGHIKFALYHHYSANGDQAKAEQLMKEGFANPDVEIDAKMEQLLWLYETTSPNDDKSEFVGGLLQEIVTQHPDEAKSHAISGDFYLRDGKTREARNAFKKASEIDPSRIAVWDQLLNLDAQLNESQWLVEDSELAIELYPTSPIFFYYNGVANNDQGNSQKALEMLTMGKDLVVNDPLLKSEFLAAIGNTYYRLKKYDKAFDNFDQSLVLNENNSLVLNNYSFYLSERSSSLEKAEAMAKRANELQPNSATFQDTYAWVLFKQKKYKEAKTWIERAISNGGENSGEILEHYGDILHELGEVDKALAYWIKAKEKGDHSDQLLQKIERKTLID